MPAHPQSRSHKSSIRKSPVCFWSSSANASTPTPAISRTNPPHWTRPRRNTRPTSPALLNAPTTSRRHCTLKPRSQQSSPSAKPIKIPFSASHFSGTPKGAPMPRGNAKNTSVVRRVPSGRRRLKTNGHPGQNHPPTVTLTVARLTTTLKLRPETLTTSSTWASTTFPRTSTTNSDGYDLQSLYRANTKTLKPLH